MPLATNDQIARARDPKSIARVKVNTGNKGGLFWDPDTCSGYPASTSRMTAITSSATYVYAFPYEPNGIEISSVSSEYVTIERPGNYPLVEYRGPQLQEVSFSFIATDRLSHGKRSIEAQMRFLSKFAALNAPIMLSGIGELMETVKKSSTAANLRSWRISDFSITIVRKNEASQVTQAECKVTLLEDRNPSLPTELIPRIVYTEIPVQIAPSSSGKPTEPPDPIVTYGNTYSINEVLLQEAGFRPGGNGV